MENNYSDVEYTTLDSTADYVESIADQMLQVINGANSSFASTVTPGVFEGLIANNITDEWNYLHNNIGNNIDNLHNVSALRTISDRYETTDSDVSKSIEVL